MQLEKEAAVPLRALLENFLEEVVFESSLEG